MDVNVQCIKVAHGGVEWESGPNHKLKVTFCGLSPCTRTCMSLISLMETLLRPARSLGQGWACQVVAGATCQI